MVDYIRGVDVSHHQIPSQLKYDVMANEGYKWLIARASYGVKPDLTFQEHIKGATKAGLEVGAYMFFRQQQDPKQQLELFTKQLDSMPTSIAPVVDLEWNSNDGPVNAKAFEGAHMILDQLREKYGEAIIYLAPGFFQTLKSPQWALEFPWWVCHYTRDAAPWCPFKAWDIWQFTGTGSSTAYPKSLDLNRARTLPKRTK